MSMRSRAVSRGLHYVHIAATQYLTALHTDGRAKSDIDAGQVLAGYTGTILRDGYAGYTHLIDAHYAWRGAHLLRDLQGSTPPTPADRPGLRDGHHPD